MTGQAGRGRGDRSWPPPTTSPPSRTRSGSSCPNPFATLGADEHGFSDTRAAARRYFHIDSHSMVVRALQLLAAAGDVDSGAAAEAAASRYQLLDVTAGTTGTAGGES